MTVQEWVEAYGRAWGEKDADAVVGLFTEDAEYRSSPFREPAVGRTRSAATGTRDVDAGVGGGRMGVPFVAGDLVAVEWWTTMVDDGCRSLPGCLLLRFARDGAAGRSASTGTSSRASTPAPRLGRVSLVLPATSRCQYRPAVRATSPWRIDFEGVERRVAEFAGISFQGLCPGVVRPTCRSRVVERARSSPRRPRTGAGRTSRSRR